MNFVFGRLIKIKTFVSSSTSVEFKLNLHLQILTRILLLFKKLPVTLAYLTGIEIILIHSITLNNFIKGFRVWETFASQSTINKYIVEITFASQGT